MKKQITLVGFMIVLSTLLITSCFLFSSNDAPDDPAAPTGQVHGAINISYNFKATTIDPNDDSIAYKFDWGNGTTSAWSSFIASGAQINMSYSWSANGTYNIKVQAEDTHGKLSDWSPTHQIVIALNNTPPVPPMPNGPSSGVVNVPNTFTATTTDADGDSIAYRFDWDNGDTSAWSVYYASGATASMAYTYTAAGNYYVRVQAKDQVGAVTDWSIAHGIIITSIAYQYTIALTWGEDPSDLDSHLWTPSIQGQAYHVCYYNRGSTTSAPYCSLDVDDVTSYGPEHIIIDSLFPGTYQYAVHHYSGDSTITTSNAQVKIYNHGALIQTFNVPNVTSQPYWSWYVFDLDGATGTITPVNTVGLDIPYPPTLNKNMKK